MRHVTLVFTLFVVGTLVADASVRETRKAKPSPGKEGGFLDAKLRKISKRMRKSLPKASDDCYEIRPKNPYKETVIICRPEATQGQEATYPHQPAPVAGHYGPQGYTMGVSSYKPPPPPPSPYKPYASAASAASSSSSSTNPLAGGQYGFAGYGFAGINHPYNNIPHSGGYQRSDLESGLAQNQGASLGLTQPLANPAQPMFLLGRASSLGELNEVCSRAAAEEQMKSGLANIRQPSQGQMIALEGADPKAAYSTMHFAQQLSPYSMDEHHIYSQNVYETGASVPYIHPPTPVAHSPVTLSCQMHRNPMDKPAAPLAVFQLYLKPDQLNLPGAQYDGGHYHLPHHHHHHHLTGDNYEEPAYREATEEDPGLSLDQNELPFIEPTAPFEEGLSFARDAADLTEAQSSLGLENERINNFNNIENNQNNLFPKADLNEDRGSMNEEYGEFDQGQSAQIESEEDGQSSFEMQRNNQQEQKNKQKKWNKNQESKLNNTHANDDGIDKRSENNGQLLSEMIARENENMKLNEQMLSSDHENGDQMEKIWNSENNRKKNKKNKKDKENLQKQINLNDKEMNMEIKNNEKDKNSQNDMRTESNLSTDNNNKQFMNNKEKNIMDSSSILQRQQQQQNFNKELNFAQHSQEMQQQQMATLNQEKQKLLNIQAMMLTEQQQQQPQEGLNNFHGGKMQATNLQKQDPFPLPVPPPPPPFVTQGAAEFTSPGKQPTQRMFTGQEAKNGLAAHARASSMVHNLNKGTPIMSLSV